MSRKIYIFFILLLASTAFAPTLKPFRGRTLNHTGRYALVGCWLMNEGTGNRIQDLSGNKNTGTLVATAQFSSAKFGSGVLLDGDSDYIDFGDPAALDLSGDITLVIWVKSNNIDGLQAIFGKSKIGDGTEKEWGLLSYDGEVWWQLSAGAGLVRLTGTTMVAGSWYCIVGTREGSTCKLYVNGGLDDTDTLAGDINPTYNCFIGRRASAAANYFSGVIDNALVFNRALSASEIALLLRKPFCFMSEDLPVSMMYEYAAPPPSGGQVIMIQMASIPLFLIIGLVFLMRVKNVE